MSTSCEASRNDRRHFREEIEVGRVESEQVIDPGLVIRCRQQRIEQPLSPQAMRAMPVEELLHSRCIGKGMINLAGRPPLQCQLAGIVDRQRSGESPWVGHDVNEFRQDLRSQRKPVAATHQFFQHGPSGRMLRMLGQLQSNQKSGVDSVIHTRPSSISSSRSSSRVSGLSSSPRSTGAMSRTLCEDDGSFCRRRAASQLNSFLCSAGRRAAAATSISARVVMASPQREREQSL
jgi:hypothetical protein